MNWKTDLTTFIILSIIVIILDIIFISTVFQKFWNNNITNIQKSAFKPKIQYGIIAYILIIAGIYFFVLPKLNSTNINTNIINGLLYGFLWGIIVYGIFDFTNLVLFENYDLKLAIMDTIWGGILTALSVTLTYYLVHVLLKMEK